MTVTAQGSVAPELAAREWTAGSGDPVEVPGRSAVARLDLDRAGSAADVGTITGGLVATVDFS